jgi:two-component system sensor histidine kinase PilS (NtrC family)
VLRKDETLMVDWDDQRQWLSWLVRVRIPFIAITLAIELIYQQVARLQNLTIAPISMKYFLAALVFWCLLDVIYIILLRISSDFVIQSWLQVVGDILMVSLVVYFTGGVDSYLYFLFPLAVLVGSIVLSRGGAFIVAGFCFIQAGMILELPYYHLIPYYGLGNPDLRELRLKIAGNLVAFLAVAYLASKLAVTLRKTGIELKDLQVLNQDIIESLRSGLITTDLKGDILLSNSTASEILAVSSEQLQGRPVASLFPEAGAREPGDLTFVRREVIWKSAEDTRFLGLSIAPLTRHGKAVGYVYNFQDLTDMKQLEHEVQLQDRMAAIGRMAAAIAHEIRNPLASIAGSVKLFSGMAALDAEEQRLIQIVLKESERLNTIITDFLQYSREMKFDFDIVNVTDILEETLTLLRNHPKFDGRYRIETNFPREPVRASLDADRMRQVFWNLGDNALKAMPQGGTLFVEMRTEGGRLAILFRDTGSGLSPRQAEKIFEPFQTEFQEGTGLGLAIVYRIIQAHKGTVRAEPERQGCAFRIELPLVTGAPGGSLERAKARL